MLSGILLGLSAALLQSVSYVASGAFVRKYHGANLALLTRAYVLMGVVSAIALPCVWPRAGMPAFREYALPMVLCTGFCILGQAGMFLALRHTEASRMSPLLGLKIPMLALAYLALGLDRYGALQWGGILLSVAAAFLLSRAGRSVPPQAWFWLLATCAAFSASDYYIAAQFRIFERSLSFTRASLVITALSYVTGGAFGVLVLPFAGRFPWSVWPRYALPFAAAWLGAMVLLFACFGTIGVVYGNIVQSTRGLISIGIGYLVARAGHAHLEQRVDRATMLRRVAAGILMLLAMALFRLGSRA